MLHALLLNADYSPIKVVRWERAVELVLDGKAVTVEPFAGRFVRSMSLALPWPAVISLRRYAVLRGRVRFSARNVLARDAWTCMYCGIRPRASDGRPIREALTLDHVIPRAHAKNGMVFLPWSRKWTKVTCWENATTACVSCNMRKGARTPMQAAMNLRSYPRAPTQADALRMMLSRFVTLPTEWEPYLPADWSAVAMTPAPEAWEAEEG